MRKLGALLRSQFSRFFSVGSIFIAALPLVLFSVQAVHSASELTLAWDPNTQLNLAGYRIYYKMGVSGPPYDGGGVTEGESPINIPVEELNYPDNPQYTIHGLSDWETYYFVVTAYDTSGGETGYSNEVYFQAGEGVPNENIRPTAYAGPDQRIKEDLPVTLDGSNSFDPDDGIAFFLWKHIDGPTVILSDAAAAKPSFNAPDVGPGGAALTFSLIVVDNSGAKSTDTCTVDVYELPGGGGVTEPIDDVSSPNRVTNGDFSDGKRRWTFYTNGSGNYSVVGGEARVAIARQGSNVQLYQKGLVLDGNTLYRLTFRARHSTGRDVIVALIKHTAPYTNYGLQQTIDLTETMQTFSMEFKTTPGLKTDGRLMFFMGSSDQNDTTYYINDVAIEKVAVCGDGVVDIGEECDDGNTTAGDRCDASCELKKECGDGIVDIGEECDDGNLIDNDSCGNDCVLNFCGDGVVNNGEDCDDRNLIDYDACSNSCLQNMQYLNVLTNGDFSNGKRWWTFYSNGSGNYSVVGGEARMAIARQGSNVQLYQKGLALDGNTLYRLTFRARHSTGRNVIVALIKNTAPYTNYGLLQTIDLTEAMQTFSIEFKTRPGAKKDGRLMFFMAPFDQDGTSYFFDDVVLEPLP